MKFQTAFLFCLIATPIFGVAQPNAHTQHIIAIEDMQYSPKQLTIHSGDTLKWMNKDLVPHTVSAPDRTFDSKTIAPNSQWTFKAKKTGVFKYKCDLHTNMAASFTVR